MKRFLSYIFIITIVAGLFSPIIEIRAQEGTGIIRQIDGSTIDPNGKTSETTKQTKPTSQTELQKELALPGRSIIDTYVLQITYFLFYTIPRFLFGMTARLFNAMLFYTLNSALYGSFIASAWIVVRDLSNIFFILLLLYTAMKLILGIGGAEVKKMIATIVVGALLINFSMFITRIVIDATNILALIFYNKLSTVVINKKGELVDLKNTDPKNKGADISGALTNNIDPTNNLDNTFFNKVREESFLPNQLTGAEGGTGTIIASAGAGALIGSVVPGVGTAVGAVVGGALGGGASYFLLTGTEASMVPTPILLGILISSGLVFAFAAYAFFMASFAFLGRLIELWLLIIFSPFAFMSFSVPELRKVDYLGWDAWLKRLTTVAFMAPIFMFFMYVIFKIVQTKPFESIVGGADYLNNKQDWMSIMLLLIIPMAMIIIMLLKAIKFAKEGGGELGNMVVKYGTMAAGMVGGLALGAATGGASLAGTQLIGRAAGNLSKTGGTLHTFAQKNKFGEFLYKKAKYLGNDASFDIRKVGAVGNLAKKGGVNLNSGLLKGIGLGEKEGGFGKRREERNKRDKEFADKMDTTEADRARMTRGGMSNEEADQISKKMIDGGMEISEAGELFAKLIKDGVSVSESKKMANYINADNRNKIADRKEKRTVKLQERTVYNNDGSLKGRYRERVDVTPAKTWFRSRNMAANTIRLPAAAAEGKAKLADTIAALATAQKAGTPAPTPAPGAGGTTP